MTDSMEKNTAQPTAIIDPCLRKRQDREKIELCRHNMPLVWCRICAENCYPCPTESESTLHHTRDLNNPYYSPR